MPFIVMITVGKNQSLHNLTCRQNLSPPLGYQKGNKNRIHFLCQICFTTSGPTSILTHIFHLKRNSLFEYSLLFVC